ncbi:PAAR domain-containing protein [Geofilum rubicundum]|uniref:Uncharacterized protein n=1 Tax=Geofilum rubicundum JCM 15548 TaxID=1236989 RepID=A0A0E9LR87_9BACT|nr:PAAR domain-containing protein [Geofilum rubicundum]GAO27764.1 hypothetical protein JCM15548_14614 [Geofilum rubicundum JCM 15548]
MAGKPVATIGSMHVCPMISGTVPHVGGPVTGPGAPNVLINGQPVALMGDMCVCAGGPDTIAQGEPGVLINGTPVATMGSMTAHGGSLVMGEPNVFISTATPQKKATLPIHRIPFPKITLLDHVGAAIKRKSADLKQARENQKQLKEAAEEGEEDAPVKITNVRLVDAQRRRKRAVKLGEKAFVLATVHNAKDGETATIVLRHDSLEGEEMVTLQGEVKDGEVLVEWHADSNYYKADGHE